MQKIHLILQQLYPQADKLVFDRNNTNIVTHYAHLYKSLKNDVIAIGKRCFNEQVSDAVNESEYSQESKDGNIFESDDDWSALLALMIKKADNDTSALLLDMYAKSIFISKSTTWKEKAAAVVHKKYGTAFKDGKAFGLDGKRTNHSMMTLMQARSAKPIMEKFHRACTQTCGFGIRSTEDPKDQAASHWVEFPLPTRLIQRRISSVAFIRYEKGNSNDNIERGWLAAGVKVLATLAAKRGIPISHITSAVVDRYNAIQSSPTDPSIEELEEGRRELEEGTEEGSADNLPPPSSLLTNTVPAAASISYNASPAYPRHSSSLLSTGTTSAVPLVANRSTASVAEPAAAATQYNASTATSTPYNASTASSNASSLSTNTTSAVPQPVATEPAAAASTVSIATEKHQPQASLLDAMNSSLGATKTASKVPKILTYSDIEVGDVGYTFRKYFPRYGWYWGEVTKIRLGAEGGKDRRVSYGDDDDEDLSVGELKTLALRDPQLLKLKRSTAPKSTAPKKKKKAASKKSKKVSPVNRKDSKSVTSKGARACPNALDANHVCLHMRCNNCFRMLPPLAKDQCTETRRSTRSGGDRSKTKGKKIDDGNIEMTSRATSSSKAKLDCKHNDAFTFEEIHSGNWTLMYANKTENIPVCCAECEHIFY